MAMAGHECVALAVDKRFGSGPQMVNIAPRHVWAPHSNLMLAFSGLEGDVQSLSEELKMEVDASRNRALGFSIGGLKAEEDEINDDLESRRSRISPSALACLTSHVLYQKRGYYVEPLVVGLMEKTRKPFLCAMDMIGAQSFSKSFICSGAASTSLYGTAEALWRPDMEPKELLECCGKVFQSGRFVLWIWNSISILWQYLTPFFGLLLSFDSSGTRLSEWVWHFDISHHQGRDCRIRPGE